MEFSTKSNTEALWTVEQVAAYLQKGPETVRGMARNGVLKAFKVGREWRFKKSLIDPSAVDARSDIYSLGAILYRCLTNQVYEGNLDSFRIMPQLPPPLKTIVQRCLKDKKEERYKDVSSLAAELNCLV